jgi:hypothetical protein
MRYRWSLGMSSFAVLAFAAACGSSHSGDSGFTPPGDDGGGSGSGGGDGGGDGASSGSSGSSSGGFGDGSLIGSQIILSPGNATVFIDTATTPPTPAKQAFTATFGGVDVTSQLSLVLQNGAVGTITGQTFTSGTSIPGGALGVTTLVTGTAAGHMGLANLTVVALHVTGTEKDFYFLEPYKQNPSPSDNVLEFNTKLTQVDVAILLDTTGSMQTSISAVQAELTTPGTGIIDGLTAAIPNVGIAIVEHRDYPYSTYGSTGDFPVRVNQTVTTSTAAAQAGANMYSLGNGFDDPESQLPAMDYIVSGAALNWPGGSVPAHIPAAGYAGGVDFRPGSFRVVAEITDAPWHNYNGTPADSLATPYSGFTAPDFNQLVKDFNAINAKYVGIVDNHSNDTHPHQESQALSDATGSNVPAAAYPGGACNPQAGAAPNGNCRLNFDITDGSPLGQSIVQAIQAISVGATYDVTAIPANDPTNPGGVDATKFIKEIRAMGEGNMANNCPKWATKKSNPSLTYNDVFSAVTAGTRVCFEIIPQVNTTVPPKTAAQFFKAFINVVGLPGDLPLDKRSVLFLVPPVSVSGSQ